MKMKNKRGELTTQHIVILIVLILSFTVILFLLFRLDLGGESEKEICHNSVVTRGSSIIPVDAVPLNCKREYICISGDGKCEDLVNPSVKKVKTLPEVYGVLADEMANCWWQFGEGKVNYVGDDFFSDLYCSICSQISLDDSLENVEGFEGGIDEREFYKYLEENEVSEGESYLKYLFDLDSVGQLEESMSQEGGSFGNLDLDKQYFVMTGIFSEVGVWQWVLGAGATAGIVTAGIIAAPFTAGISTVATVSLIGGATIGGGFAGEFIGTVVKGDGVKNGFLAPTLLEANSEEFEAFECEDILTRA